MSRHDARTPTYFDINNVEAIEELMPEDKQLAEPRIVWEKVSEFRGSIKGTRINNSGELIFSIEVPFEDKMLALPITDTRGILMVFSVYKPEGEQPTREGDEDKFKGSNGR